MLASNGRMDAIPKFFLGEPALVEELRQQRASAAEGFLKIRILFVYRIDHEDLRNAIMIGKIHPAFGADADAVLCGTVTKAKSPTCKVTSASLMKSR